MKHSITSHLSSLILPSVIVLILAGCGTARQVQVVERVSRDTLYLNRIQYDSVYVYNLHSSDYLPSLQGGIKEGPPDTVYIKDVQYEYKYKFLRDTVYRVQVDTVPIVREVEVVKSDRYIPWYTKVLTWIGVVTLFLAVLGVVRKEVGSG